MHKALLVVASLIAVVFAGMPSAVNAQEPSPNARLLAAARSGDSPGVIRALGDGASPNARNRLGEENRGWYIGTTTLGKAPSIPATTITTRAFWIRFCSLSRRWMPATPTS